jgi:hypothetical protein
MESHFNAVVCCTVYAVSAVNFPLIRHLFYRNITLMLLLRI